LKWLALIISFKIKNWVSTEILKGETAQQRCALIEIFVQVALYHIELHNYNGIMEILSSLFSDAIGSLNLSWKDLPKKSLEDIDNLSKLMSPQKNFKNYRMALQEIGNQPAIPYLGVFLNDFTFLDEIKEWKVGDLIDFDKCRAIGSMLKQFQEFQAASTNYPMLPVERMKNYILSAEIWEESDLLHVAQMREELDLANVNTYVQRHGFKKYINGRSNILTDVQSLSSREWDLLLTNASVVGYTKGEVVFEEGTYNRHLYRVKQGKFVVKKRSGEGEETILSRLGTSAIFGEMSCLSFKTSASVVCEEEGSELWVLEIRLLKKIFSTEPGTLPSFVYS
jgi:hypothetical protein